MSNRFIQADFPLYEGTKVPHLRIAEGDVAPCVLLPGDPGRVDLIGDLFDSYQILSSNREFKVGTGDYHGTPVSVCSTGIGGPSTEIAVLELLRLKAKCLLRIGGTAAIQEGIDCGDIIINTGSVRLGGSTSHYARPEYPAVANHYVVQALIEACERLGHRYHLGIGATTSSFYHGQGRNVSPMNYSANIIDEMKALGVINLEMESETILTISSVLGAYAGTLLVVHANRVTNQWLVDYEESQLKMCKTALLAVEILTKKGVF
ncbi:nucleoside phosphorylase [Paenibacillus thalictri]|uniref:Nucleoside phosphorylase n=1 Tax=Paenibacillus thalictri TaxID=2527873 RepID=A0A4Q9DDT1_9BACL|nr:nucleoside phosphorylase [Paenibacillus thalictri]TBL69363.1 nucleoside phosphorylase [Paenibacillus thalictri]